VLMCFVKPSNNSLGTNCLKLLVGVRGCLQPLKRTVSVPVSGHAFRQEESVASNKYFCLITKSFLEVYRREAGASRGALPSWSLVTSQTSHKRVNPATLAPKLRFTLAPRASSLGAGFPKLQLGC
jgi:hypothetical protein